MRVKQFWSSSWSPGALDFKINRWLKGNRVDIIDMSNKNVGEELWDGYHDDTINAFYDGYSQAQDEYRAYKKDNNSKES